MRKPSKKATNLRRAERAAATDHDRVTLWLAGHRAGIIDARKDYEKETHTTRRGVEICRTCGFSVNTYAHSEICGV